MLCLGEGESGKRRKGGKNELKNVIWMNRK